MTPSQLYDGILKAMNDKEAIDLIGKAKSEWCKEQRNLCAKESLGFFDNKKAFINIVLNAPEP